MKCQHHEGQLKTHICLKSLCKHQIICPICITKEHQNHMTIELMQFKRAVANMISVHDNPEPLENLGDLAQQVIKLENTLQDQLKLLYLRKKDTIELDQFKLVEGILRVEQPTISQLMALKRVGQQMLFFKDQQNQWTFQLVADNREYKVWDKLITDLRTQMKSQKENLLNLVESLKQISIQIEQELSKKLQSSFDDQLQEDGYNNIIKKIKAEGFEPKEVYMPKTEQQQSLQLFEMLENNSDSESAPKVTFIKQQQQPQQTHISQQEISSFQSEIKPFHMQPDRKFISVKQSTDQNPEQPREKRKYVKKAEKLLMESQKRIYRRKTYDRFKFNTNQCIDVFKEMLN